MSASLTDQYLIDFSREHLLHELTMFWELAKTLPRRKEGTTEYVALIESFATHLRNLIEFFFHGKKGAYVRAQHFFGDPAAWSPNFTPNFKKLLDRANNEVSHLTVWRVSGTPPEKAWPIDEILMQMQPVAKDFATKASKNKLHAKVREFLHLPPEAIEKWIATNVAHSNVVSHIMTSSAFSNASTATRIITTVPLA